MTARPVDIQRMTVLEPEDLLTTIRIPNTWAGANFYFEKVADRGAWDFPLVNVAAALRLEGGRIADARVVVGAVECIPSAPDGRRRPRERPRPERGDRCHGGRRSRSGSGALALQPLQGAAHGEPREEGRARRLRPCYAEDSSQLVSAPVLIAKCSPALPRAAPCQCSSSGSITTTRTDPLPEPSSADRKRSARASRSSRLRKSLVMRPAGDAGVSRSLSDPR